MAIQKNFVVRHGIEVAENLIYTEGQSVGIGTTSPDYLLSVGGNLSLSGGFYVPTENALVKIAAGIVSNTSLDVISGINTSSLLVGDYLVDLGGTYIQSDTRVTGIGSSSLTILPNHTNSSGSATTVFIFSRYKESGKLGDVLISQGNGLPPIWDIPIASAATTSTNVIGGIASVTQLNVSGVSTLGFVTATDINVSGAVTAINFYGNLTGTATTSTDVIGGIVSVTTGIFSGSTSSELVRITQTGSGNALKVEDSANPDSTSFIIDNSGKVGIKTSQPNYDLDIRGTTLFGGSVYLAGGQLTTRVGIVSGANRSIISGIDTTGIEISDFVDDEGTLISPGTVVTSVGINSIGISNEHGKYGLEEVEIFITREFYAGLEGEVLVSRGSGLPPNWSSASNAAIRNISTTTTYYPTFVENSGFQPISIAKSELLFVPDPGNLGIGSTSPTERLDVGGNIKVSGSISVGTTATIGFVTATNANVSGTATVGVLSATNANIGILTATTVDAISYLGNAAAVTGIVTQLTAGTGIRLSSTQSEGKGSVRIDSYFPIGKTIFVTQNGSDSNGGLTESDSKRTIKAAAAIAFPGDTIKVYPGVYVEENPIYLSKRVAVEGTELRNCVVTPKYRDRDLFYVNNSCHITDLSFIGNTMTDGAAIVALQPLAGVSTDRYFDAARMIRYNLDYIAKESVGFLTSTQYIGAGRTQVSDPVFQVVDGEGSPVDPSNCSDDIKDILKCVIHDITRGGNLKCVGAGLSYYSDGALVHIGGTDVNGYSVKDATIDTIKYAAGIARAVINNSTWGSQPVGLGTTVTDATYDNTTGVTTITASNHGLADNDAVKIVGLGFTCPSGPGIVTYPSGNLGYIFNVKSVLNPNTFEVVVGQSTLPHTYVSGGTVQKYGNFQNEFTQVKDLSIQADPLTGFNNAIDGCANVVSAIYSCVGVVTTILDQGLSVLGAGINTTFPGNSGIGFTTIIGVTSAVYDNTSGETTILAPTLSVKPGDIVEVRDLLFDCTSGGSIGTQKYPSGAYGYEFDVESVNNDGSFVINTGVSTIAHNYVGGGFVVNRAIGVTTASYDNTTGITTITAPGVVVKVGQFVRLHDLEFSCTSGAGTTTLYPTGNLGYDFKVTEVIGTGTTFVVNTGVSTIPHTYEGGGVVFPPYSPGVGPITQGPYVRNCTNFVPGSIGMKIDGFEAEPGDKDDIGVTGTMSVDSYTQYNQGGIGVSITNGAYAQLVSIFTICDDIAIFTGSGGQCDITNSNSSFGRLGLVADGVGDATSKSIYRSTGIAVTDAIKGNNVVEISGLGNYRPYDGQVCYFGELYNFVDTIEITNSGSGYVSAPRVTISPPEDDNNGITAQASSTIDAFGRVTAINIVNSGTQYLNPPTVTIDPPPIGFTTATAEVTKMQPIYYKVDSATLPSAGISTVSFLQNLNNTVSVGTTVYFNRVSLQITSSHSFEWVGSGNDINTAKPALGGVVISENEVVQDNGGIVVYTSTDQAGNFKIGDGVVINQATGQISGRDFTKALFTTMTPFILALSE